MDIFKVKIKDLKPSEYNPRAMSEKEAEALEESLRRFGFVEPIVVNGAKNRKGIIIGGHQRFYIAKKMGMVEIPVVYINIPDIKKERELNLRLNKNLGHWDYDLLANFEEEMLLDTGFESEELDKIFDLEVEEEDEVPEIPKKPVSKLEEIYQLGDHRLMCGDATKKEDVEKLTGKNTIQLCFTSPPYNMAGGMYEGYADNLKSEKFIDLHLTVLANIKKHLKGFIFWNVSYNKNSRWEFLEILLKIAKESGLRFLELIIWDKGHALPIISQEGLTRRYEEILLAGDEDSFKKDIEIFSLSTTEKKAHFNKKTNKGITNYWRVETNQSQIEELRDCFPVALPKRGITLMTNRGDNVIDPFGGSGSTLIACEQLNRKCYMMEIDPRYIDVIIKRWEKLTNQKAKKL